MEKGITVNNGRNQVIGSAGEVVTNYYYGQTGGAAPRTPAGTVAVLGGGAEAAMGMPTTHDLIPLMTDWLKTDMGRAVDEGLRKMLPRLNFRYERFVDQGIDRLAQGADGGRERIVRAIGAELRRGEGLTEGQRKMGRLILRMLKKVSETRDSAAIDEETERLVSETLEIEPTADSIIDFSKTSFTRYFQDVMRGILRRSMDGTDDPVLRHVYTHTLDIERLLESHFRGFYAQNRPQVKSYMYISWTIWAFLVSRQRERGAGGEPPAFCARLAEAADTQAVNLNYTSLPVRPRRDAIYLRGTLADYVDAENKNDFHLDLDRLDLVDFFRQELPRQVSLSDDRPLALPIPSFMPPMKLPTLVSGHYIPTLYQASRAIEEAHRLVLLGVSFDPHRDFLADMLRANRQADVLCCCRDLETDAPALCRAFHLPRDYSPFTFQGHEARKYDNRVTVVGADLKEVDLGEWLE